MKRYFKDAILSTGGLARPASGKPGSFAASIQPSGFEGDGHGEPGEGFLKGYMLFAEFNETSEKLRDGDIILFGERSYLIKCAAPVLFRDTPVYLKGMLTLCEEGDQ